MGERVGLRGARRRSGRIGLVLATAEHQASKEEKEAHRPAAEREPVTAGS